MKSPERDERKAKIRAPIRDAIQSWLPAALRSLEGQEPDIGGGGVETATLVAAAPKRWVVYEPMVLLPSGSFSSAGWTSLMAALPPDQLSLLWARILHEVSNHARRPPLTHLAINEGIPLLQQADGANSKENILRSPSGLRMLYGDFGPDAAPPDRRFAMAFWVSTKQNGIYQTWAPRWTMFSRGNVKEKARLLAFHDGETTAAKPEGPSLAQRAWPRRRLESSWAVDLYAGIGYFVFSYARLGLRVLCWELNAWSVEGLRRGALRNGWSVKVVQGHHLERPTRELVRGQDRIIVFLEDNREAARRVQELRSEGMELIVSHVNCGFLPSSQPTWQWGVEYRRHQAEKAGSTYTRT